MIPSNDNITIFGAFKNILIGVLFKCIHQNRYSILDVSESGRHVVGVNFTLLNFNLKTTVGEHCRVNVGTPLLPPSFPEGLLFHVTFRPLRSAVGDASGGELLSKEIVWQEKYPKVFGPPNEENQRVCIFTYTSADFVPYDGESSNCKKGNLYDANLVGQGFSLRNKQRVKHTYWGKLNDMMLREEVMVIMAAVNCSTEYQEIVLCLIKLNPTGLVFSYPSISEVETEDFEDTSVFMSRRSVDAVIGNGPRLLTYSFTLAKSLYEYTIEWNGAPISIPSSRRKHHL
jgi:hypothetical protein